MNQFEFLFVLIVAVLALNHALGGPINGRLKTKGDFYIPNREGQSNLGRGEVILSRKEQPGENAGSSYQQIHPEEKYQTSEFDSRLNIEVHSSNSENDHQSEFRSGVGEIIDRLVDTSGVYDEQPLDLSISHSAKASNQDQDLAASHSLEDLIKDLDLEAPHSSEALNTDLNLAARHFIDETFKIDNKFTNKLIASSGVDIDKSVLNELTIRFKYKPKKLLRKLIQETIDPYQLRTLHENHIPQEVLDAIKEYTDFHAEPKLTHEEVKRIMKKMMQQQRFTYRDKFMNREVDNSKNLPIDTHTKVELITGTGVMLEKVKLDGILKRYRNNAKELVRQLFSALIPMEELAKMQITKYGPYKVVPENIKNTIEAFVRIEAAVPLRGPSFLSTVKKFLSSVRIKLDKEKVQKEKKNQNQN